MSHSAFKNTDRFYDRDNNPLDLETWGRMNENDDYKIIKQELVGKYFVSTVWIGLDMSHWNEMPPLIFETMIFIEEGDESKDPLNDYQVRYTTETQAMDGHEKAVKIAKGGLYGLDQC